MDATDEVVDIEAGTVASNLPNGVGFNKAATDAWLRGDARGVRISDAWEAAQKSPEGAKAYYRTRSVEQRPAPYRITVEVDSRLTCSVL